MKIMCVIHLYRVAFLKIRCVARSARAVVFNIFLKQKNIKKKTNLEGICEFLMLVNAKSKCSAMCCSAMLYYAQLVVALLRVALLC